jgi:hypothetical protein
MITPFYIIIEVLEVTIFGKCLYIAFFIIVFLFTTIWNYFNSGHWALLENLFFAFWVASFLFMALLLRSKKVESEKADNRS